MYRCKECGAEYEVKPDYCDCGNDEFEAAGVNKSAGADISKTVSSEEKTAETLKEKKAEEKPKPRPAAAERTTFTPPPPKKLTFDEQYPVLSRMIKSVDPLSLAIFCICLVFSAYIVFFAWNPDTTVTAVEQKAEVTTFKNIPSIDKIWNNEVPVIKKEEPKAEEKAENIIKQILPVQTQKKSIATPKTTSNAKQKVTTVPLKKTESKSKTTVQNKTTVTKTQSSTAAQDKAKKEAEEKIKQEALAKQKAEQEQKAAEAAQIKKLQAEQAKKAEAERLKQEAANRQEYINYKAQLRNTIGRKIDFTRVIGDGSCTVAFKIDSTGKLINRSFAKQSSNNTLNDAVYNAVMSTPAFNPPPAAYKNETLNLSISFYNGNFEISLP